MTLFNYLRANGAADLRGDSIAIRAGYLFADVVVSTEMAHFFIHNSTGLPAYSQDSKNKIVENDIANKTDDLSQKLKQILSYSKIIKKRKHKTREELVLIRKADDSVNTFFKLMMEDQNAKLSQLAFWQLKDITDAGLAFCNVNDTIPEDEQNNCTPASKLLQPAEDGDGEGAISDVLLILPDAYRSAPAEEMFLRLPAAGTFMPGDAGWLTPVLETPNLLSLTGVELQVVREQLREPSQDFRTAFDQWIAWALSGEKDVQERLGFFQASVQPAAAKLQDAVNTNKVLSGTLAAQQGAANLRFLAGEAPLQAVWSFFESLGILADETISKLRESPHGSKRMPLIVMRNLTDINESFTARDASAEDTDDMIAAMPVSVRKTISPD